MRTGPSTFIAAGLAGTISGGTAFAQFTGLKIVVVEGEDAVNIIQQRSAVAPLVEVRDRNNLPVAGVAVLFTIGGGTAAFANGSTLAVTTNAAGRATAAGPTPTGSGTVQVNVTATFNGQTASARITQTNFATVEDAARAGRTPSQNSGAPKSTASGKAAGGKSSTVMAVVGAAAAGGAVIASKTRGGSSSTSPSTPTSPSGPGPASPTSSSFNLAGTFSGNLVATATMTVPGAGTFVCNLPTALSGSLRMALTQQGSSVNGTMTGNDTITMLSTTCGIPLPGGGANTSAISGPVTGSPASLVFNQTVDMSAQGTPGITKLLIYSMSGALNGGVFSGTLTITMKQDGQGFSASGSTSMPVTLR